MGSMSHMRQESPGFSRGEEFKLLLSFLFFLSVQHPHLLGRKVARCVRVGCVGFSTMTAVVEFLRCFRFGSVSSGMCGLIWIVTALIWLFLIRWDDKPDGLDGSDLEGSSE